MARKIELERSIFNCHSELKMVEEEIAYLQKAFEEIKANGREMYENEF